MQYRSLSSVVNHHAVILLVCNHTQVIVGLICEVWLRLMMVPFLRNWWHMKSTTFLVSPPMSWTTFSVSSHMGWAANHGLRESIESLVSITTHRLTIINHPSPVWTNAMNQFFITESIKNVPSSTNYLISQPSITHAPTSNLAVLSHQSTMKELRINLAHPLSNHPWTNHSLVINWPLINCELTVTESTSSDSFIK